MGLGRRETRLETVIGERSEAIQRLSRIMDCFVASLPCANAFAFVAGNDEGFAVWD
jgi:hypothetical protein